jgi:hypoxanthine phosphoribosyltransferase
VWRGGAPSGYRAEVLEYNGIGAITFRYASSTPASTSRLGRAVHAIDYLVSRLTFEDRLLLIDDVFDSGRSLEAIIDELAHRCRLPEHIRIATVYQAVAQSPTGSSRYYVHETDQWLVFRTSCRLTRENPAAQPVDEGSLGAERIAMHLPTLSRYLALPLRAAPRRSSSFSFFLPSHRTAACSAFRSRSLCCRGFQMRVRVARPHDRRVEPPVYRRNDQSSERAALPHFC